MTYQKISIFEHQACEISLKIPNENIGDWLCYGSGIRKGYQECIHFSVEPDTVKNKFKITIPSIDVKSAALKFELYDYQIFLKNINTHQEFLVISGEIEVKKRTCIHDAEGAISDTSIELEASISETSLDVEVNIAGGLSAYQIAKLHGYGGSEKEWIAELEGAAAAANSAKKSENDAQLSLAASLEAQVKCEEEARKSENFKNETFVLLQSAETSAQNALDAAVAAQESAVIAEQKKAAAEQSAIDANNAKIASETSENKVKAIEEDTIIAQNAAEKAAADALTAQITAEEQAEIATQAAADAQSPASIAAQAARPATMFLLKDELLALLGDASLFDIDTDGQAIIIHTDRLADDQLAAVDDMLARYVPQFIEVVRYNQSIDIPWQDWQSGLRQVDWIGADGNQKVETDLYLDSSSRVETLIKSYGANTYRYFFDSNSASPNMYGFQQQYERVWVQRYGNEHQIYSIHYDMPDSGTDIVIEMEKGSTWLNGVKQSAVAKNPDAVFECTAPAVLFAGANGSAAIVCTIGYLRIFKNGVLARNYIPAVDELGNGCLYDTVTRAAKFSTGKLGLLHPEQETEVATYSLRRPVMYGELTEHGLRRLHHVPQGCNMTKEEYAEANGFKPIVETEQPETGYWSPRWHETEDEIVLEWVETEPPMDEFGLPDETLTNN